MSDFLPPVVAVLGAEVSGFSTGIGKAISEMGKAETSFGKLAAVGKAAFLGLGVAAVGIGAESVKLAASFDQAMELIHTQAGASQQEVDALKNKVLALAPTVGIGPEKLAEGLYHVESAGFRGATAMDIMTAAAKGAAIGGANLEDVTQAMIGVMASGISGVKDANDAMAILNQTVGIGDMRMEGLAKAIGTGILPTAKNFGLSMTDVSAALATVTDNATPPDEAATRLRMTFSLLAVQTPAAAKALSSIGITSGELGTDLRKPNGLMVAIMDLKTHLEKSGKTAVEQGQIISQAFGGGKSAGTIETLLGESDRLKDKYQELGTSASRAGKFQDAWAKQQQQFSQQLKQLGAELQAAGVKIGNFLIPKIQGAVDWMSKHKDIVKVLAVAIGGVLVVAIGAYTVAMAQAAIATIAATWEILLIIAAVALVAIGIYELVKHWHTVWGFIKRIAADVWHWLEHAWDATWHAIMSAVGWIRSKIIDPIVRFFDAFLVKPAIAVFKVFSNMWKAEWNVIKGTAEFAWGFISVIFNDVKRVIEAVLTPVIHALEKAWSAVWDAIKKKFDEWWAGAKIVFGWIDQYGVKPVESALSWLHKRWDEIWSGIKKLFDEWWAGVKKIFGYIKRDGIDPIHDALSWLGKRWDDIWGGIKSAIHDAWNFMKPIFDKINGAISTVSNGLKFIEHSPGKAGEAVAHLLGFADGGWVPGSPGEAQLAVVHGGEFVLSRDMLASMRGSGGSVSGTTPLPRMAAGVGAQTITIQNNLTLQVDGKQLHAALIPAAQQYKKRTGTTGLS